MQHLIHTEFWQWALVAIAAASLGACGGGGESAGTVGTSVPMDSVGLLAAPTPSPIALVSNLNAASTCGIPDFQNLILQRVNALRTAGATCSGRPAPAVPAVQWSSPLFSAAWVHSEDMVSNNFFGHTGSDGKDASQRVSDQGYQWSFVAENIAAGQNDVQSVVDKWMESTAGHCENIMNVTAQDIGVACVISPNDPNGYGTNWTMVLASH